MSDNNTQLITEANSLLNALETDISEMFAQQDQMFSTQSLQLAAQEKMEKDAKDIIAKLNELGYKPKPQCINQLIKQHEHTDITSITCILKIDNKHIAISAEQGSVYLYTVNVDNNSSLLQFVHKNAHNSNIRSMLLWHSRLVTTCEQGRINMWDIRSKKLVLYASINKAHDDVINKVILLSNGYLATASNDSSVKIWNISTATPTMKHHLQNNESKAYAVAETTQSKLLAVSYDGVIAVYTISNLQEQPSLLKDDKFKNVYTTCNNGLLALPNDTIAVIATSQEKKGIIIINPKKPATIVSHVNTNDFAFVAEMCLTTWSGHSLVCVSDGWLCHLSSSTHAKFHVFHTNKEFKGTAVVCIEQNKHNYVVIPNSNNRGFIIYKVMYDV